MGEGKENCGGRNCFSAPNEIFRTVLNIRKLNTLAFLNPCLASGVWDCVSRLAKEKARKKNQQILQTANSIFEHRPCRAPFNAQHHKWCEVCWEEHRWQLLPLDKTVSEGIYSHTGLQKNHFGNCKPTSSAICT